MNKYTVIATEAFKRWNLKPFELDHIPNAGEVFEVTKARLLLLSKNNPYHEVFVLVKPEELVDTKQEEPVVIKVEEEKQVEQPKKKRGRKKKITSEGE